MSTQTRRFQNNDWCVDVEEKSWSENIAGLLVFGIIAAFGYATIQTVGANAGVLVGVFGTAFLYLLLLFGQRLDRIQKGEYVIWMRNNKREPDSEEVDEWRRENR